jgi:epoxyqueuosine reductase
VDELVISLLDLARRLGFTLGGVAPATEADHFAQFQTWLNKGYAGDMAYLSKNPQLRQHPNGVLSSVKSVVMLGFEYGPGADTPLPANHGRVAAYAQGPDYHPLLWAKLNTLADWLKHHAPGCECKGVVDTAPLLERDFARRAGLGWVGKNTMLIHPRHGSYFFLAALLTDLELPHSKPFTANHCGTCTACLKACPTQAFPAPGVLDATRCISYLTIEHRRAVSRAEWVDDWIYGCDVCQQVCPWNRFAQPGAFPKTADLQSLDCMELLSLTDAQFRARFRGTVFFRAKRTGLLRNACLVLGNTGTGACIPALEAAARDEDPLIAEAACWALARVRVRAG